MAARNSRIGQPASGTQTSAPSQTKSPPCLPTPTLPATIPSIQTSCHSAEPFSPALPSPPCLRRSFVPAPPTHQFPLTGTNYSDQSPADSRSARSSPGYPAESSSLYLTASNTAQYPAPSTGISVPLAHTRGTRGY